MTIRLFNCLFVLISLWGSSCNQNSHSQKSDAGEMSDFIFPFLLDTSDFEGYEPEIARRKITWLSTAIYHPLYIGEFRDTLVIYHPFMLERPPSLNSSVDSTALEVTSYRNPFAEYYLDWQDNRSYRYWEEARIDIQIDTLSPIRNNYPILLTNYEMDTIIVGYGDQVPLILEAKDSTGNWRPIEERFIFACGNGVGSIILPPKQVLITAAPVFEGDYQTELRLSLGSNYSKTFIGKINYRQFESIFNEYGDYRQEYLDENGIK
jgi:hypothetical protein